MAKRKRKPKAASEGPIVPPLPSGINQSVILQLFRLISLLSNYVRQINADLVNRNPASAQQNAVFANMVSGQLQSLGQKNPGVQIFLSAVSTALSQQQSLDEFLAELGSYTP